jgi:hypothetical protein
MARAPPRSDSAPALLGKDLNLDTGSSGLRSRALSLLQNYTASAPASLAALSPGTCSRDVLWAAARSNFASKICSDLNASWSFGSCWGPAAPVKARRFTFATHASASEQNELLLGAEIQANIIFDALRDLLDCAVLEGWGLSPTPSTHLLSPRVVCLYHR